MLESTLGYEEMTAHLRRGCDGIMILENEKAIQRRETGGLERVNEG